MSRGVKNGIIDSTSAEPALRVGERDREHREAHDEREHHQEREALRLLLRC